MLIALLIDARRRGSRRAFADYYEIKRDVVMGDKESRYRREALPRIEGSKKKCATGAETKALKFPSD